MITLAKDGMRTDLERIWRLCFDDPAEYVRYFFDFRYNPNACAVFIDESVGRPVAMLHMLDASITEDSEVVPAQYIYAAATRPDYQRRGIMRQLLIFARRYAAAGNQRYQILVPGSRELFKYYENNGFYRCFKNRSVFMTRSDLIAISGYKKGRPSSGGKGNALSVNDINSVRRDLLVDREGFVTWDYQAFNYAVGIHEHSGGEIIAAANDVDAGYAFCRVQDETVVVSELIAHSDFCPELICRLLDTFPQERYEFAVPVYNEFFSQFGEVVDYGMISAVSGRKPINILTLTGTHTPYLGLALD